MPNTWVLTATGILLLVGGFIALLDPFGATIAAERLAGVLFLLGGILQAVAVFRATGWGARIWAGIVAAAFIWMGISLLAHPLAGIVALTLVAALMFLVGGVAKVVMALLALRGTGAPFWTTLVSGVISVVLAVMVFGNVFQAATVLLGTLLAIELISSGITFIAIGRAAKSLGAEAETAS